MEYSILIFLHIIGAAIWAGGHLILSIGILPPALKEKKAEIVQQFEQRYEKIGVPALFIQVLTGLRLAYLFEPEFGSWLNFDSRVSIHISLKLILLALTLILAIHARTRLVPKLSHENLSFLAVHIISVTILAVLLVMVGVSLRVGGFF